MIIAISGSVGSGKTTISKELAKRLNEKILASEFSFQKKNVFEVIHLNELVLKYKISDVKELETFDFDIDKFVFDFNTFLSENKERNLIVEGHFAHFLNPEQIDVLFVIGRDLEKLKEEYSKRKYNKKKIEDNLEVESFNLCFYEALEEGFREEEQVFLVENNFNLDEALKVIISKVKEINDNF